MKIKLNCNSGANIHSNRTETVDTVKDWNLNEGEWEGMSDEIKNDMVNEWAQDRLEIYWEPA